MPLKVRIVICILVCMLVLTACQDKSAPTRLGNEQGRTVTKKMTTWSYSSAGNQFVGAHCTWYVMGPKFKVNGKTMRARVASGSTGKRNRTQTVTFYPSYKGGLFYSDQCAQWVRSDLR